MWETTSLATIKLVITTTIQNVGAVKVLPNMGGSTLTGEEGIRG